MKLVLVLLFAFQCLAVPVPAFDQNWDLQFCDNCGPLPRPTETQFNYKLLAKAQPDQCFCAGQSPIPGPCTASSTCLNGDTPVNKTNEAYIWGMVQAGNSIYFGTVANVPCFIGRQAVQTPDYVCLASAANPFADFVPPRLYRYDIPSDTLTVIGKVPEHPLLGLTFGIRAAGRANGVIILAGPGIGPSGITGVNFFAFSEATGEFLAAHSIPEYNDIRGFTPEISGAMYTGVGMTDGTPGKILRYIGNVNQPLGRSVFLVVGQVEFGFPAEVVLYRNRLAVSIWPASAGLTRINGEGGLALSPGPAQSLSTSEPANFTTIWRASDYEPDTILRTTYAVGKPIEYRGWLYWGTMHVPGSGLLRYLAVNPSLANQPALLPSLFFGTQRATAFFRVRLQNNGNLTVPELLYGESCLPTFDGNAPGVWSLEPNVGLQRPKFGRSGFGNLFNSYSWTSRVWNGKLFIGTFDSSHILLAGTFPNLEFAQDTIQQLFGGRALLPLFSYQPITYGADLYVLETDVNGVLNAPAKSITLNGLGNYLNYGIRNLIVDEQVPESRQTYIYVGTANPYNLASQGGWELIRFGV